MQITKSVCHVKEEPYVKVDAKRITLITSIRLKILFSVGTEIKTNLGKSCRYVKKLIGIGFMICRYFNETEVRLTQKYLSVFLAGSSN